MALLTAVSAVATGTTWTPAAVSASDTINATDLGAVGAILVVINGGASPDTVTVVDASLTPAGNAATNQTVSVANGTTKAIFIPNDVVNNSTGLATVTHGFTTSVTCVLLRMA